MQQYDSTTPKIGRRISLHGNKGTILYVGKVEGIHGTWLGIEWDNPEKGKHSGDKDGKQYFVCRVPGSGSFIRPSPAISYGQSFLRALISKYVDTPHSSGQKETVILGSSNGTIEVEAIGLDKVRGKLARLERLREISLDAEDVSCADPPGEIRKKCPHVRSLDLSNSLLGSWDTVALIAAELLALRTLSLNRNRFAHLSDPRSMYAAFSTLEDLRLNEALITWPEVIRLTSVMPSLRTLELGYNKLVFLGGTALENGPVPATKLKELNLDENKLHNWIDVMTSISPFRTLDRLILTSNQINRIPQAPSQSALPNVEHLGLQDNQLSAWSDFDALNVWLPKLKTLSLSGNPILSRSPDFRQQVIVRLPCLESLNGTIVRELYRRSLEKPRRLGLTGNTVYNSQISIKERTDSEIYCLSQIAQNSQNSGSERGREFPRWQELCAKHGAPDERSAARGRNTLAERLINIHVHYCQRTEPEIPETLAPRSASSLMALLPPPFTLRVLPTMPARLLRPKILKVLKLPVDRTHQGRGVDTNASIWMLMGDATVTKLDLEQETRDLAWWGIQDDSHIVMFASITDQG